MKYLKLFTTEQNLATTASLIINDSAQLHSEIAFLLPLSVTTLVLLGDVLVNDILIRLASFLR